jgi:hypothetical protein
MPARWARRTVAATVVEPERPAAAMAARLPRFSFTTSGARASRSRSSAASPTRISPPRTPMVAGHAPFSRTASSSAAATRRPSGCGRPWVTSVVSSATTGRRMARASTISGATTSALTPRTTRAAWRRPRPGCTRRARPVPTRRGRPHGVLAPDLPLVLAQEERVDPVEHASPGLERVGPENEPGIEGDEGARSPRQPCGQGLLDLERHRRDVEGPGGGPRFRDVLRGRGDVRVGRAVHPVDDLASPSFVEEPGAPPRPAQVVDAREVDASPGQSVERPGRVVRPEQAHDSRVEAGQ